MQQYLAFAKQTKTSKRFFRNRVKSTIWPESGKRPTTTVLPTLR